MIAKVLTSRNLTKARIKVQANRGSAGIDGMSVEELTEFIRVQRSDICTQIISGRYKPQAIKGVAIPKGNGKARLLGVPGNRQVASTSGKPTTGYLLRTRF